MAKAFEQKTVVLELTPFEAEVLWHVLEHVDPEDPNQRQFTSVLGIRMALLNHVGNRLGAGDEGEEEDVISGRLRFNP